MNYILEEELCTASNTTTTKDETITSRMYNSQEKSLNFPKSKKSKTAIATKATHCHYALPA